MLLEAVNKPQRISYMSSSDDRICNWTIRASCDHVVEITTLQIFNESNSDHIFVSALYFAKISF